MRQDWLNSPPRGLVPVERRSKPESCHTLHQPPRWGLPPSSADQNQSAHDHGPTGASPAVAQRNSLKRHLVMIIGSMGTSPIVARLHATVLNLPPCGLVPVERSESRSTDATFFLPRFGSRAKPAPRILHQAASMKLGHNLLHNGRNFRRVSRIRTRLTDRTAADRLICETMIG